MLAKRVAIHCSLAYHQWPPSWKPTTSKEITYNEMICPKGCSRKLRSTKTWDNLCSFYIIAIKTYLWLIGTDTVQGAPKPYQNRVLCIQLALCQEVSAFTPRSMLPIPAAVIGNGWFFQAWIELTLRVQRYEGKCDALSYLSPNESQ